MNRAQPLEQTSTQQILQDAKHAHMRGVLDVAEKGYIRILSSNRVDSNTEEAAVNLGALLRQSQRLYEANAHYTKWLEIIGYKPGISMNAMNCQRDMGNYEQGIRIANKCIELNKSNVSDILRGKAECLLEIGKLKESRSILEQLLMKDPENFKLWISAGICLARQGMLAQATTAFEKAQKFGADISEMVANRISLLKDLGRIEEAACLLVGLSEEVLSSVPIRNSRAGLLLATRKAAEASIEYQKLCIATPEDSSCWLNWAASLRSLKYTVAPHKVLKAAIQFHPNSIDLYEALAQGYAEMCEERQAMKAIDLSCRLAGRENTSKDIHFFNRQFIGLTGSLITSARLKKEAEEWENSKMHNGIVMLYADSLSEPIQSRQIRVGYLTADVCNHPVGRFLLPILQGHSKELISTWLLNCGNAKDDVSKQLNLAADNTVELGHLNDLEAARVIADLRLDVLVELGGYSSGNRIAILTHRPAPVQLSYLGYPGATYLKCVDGWIGDPILFGDLDLHQAQAHELLMVNGGYMAMPIFPEIEIPEISNRSTITFGCFNHARKLSSYSINMFSLLLNSFPEARLVMKSISFHETEERQRIQAKFERAGVESSRISLLDSAANYIEHMNMYSEVDIAIDTTPYGGATTTFEALWMGVPVLTIAGRGMAGRLSASILHYAGLNNWIANDETELTTIARTLAGEGTRDRNRRIELRGVLQDNKNLSGKRLAKSLENIYFEQIAKRKRLI